MIPVIEHSSLLTILYWLLMIPIAILVLVRVTAFWADDGPGHVSRPLLPRDAAFSAVYPTVLSAGGQHGSLFGQYD